MFLINYILQNYSHKTLDELYLAFDLAIKDELELDDVKVYDQFSVEYLVRIMTAYKKWLNKQSKNIIQKPKEEMQQEITKEEKYEEINEWKNKDKINLYLIPVYLYDWLKEFGMINPTTEEKKEIYKSAETMHTEKLKQDGILKSNLDDYNDFKKNGNKQVIVNLSKKLIVYNYLKKKTIN